MTENNLLVLPVHIFNILKYNKNTRIRKSFKLWFGLVPAGASSDPSESLTSKTVGKKGFKCVITSIFAQSGGNSSVKIIILVSF